jgi:uncharacterized protein YjiS (DUF1127 family)
MTLIQRNVRLIWQCLAGARYAELEYAMTAESKLYPPVQKLVDTFAAWLNHRREFNELHRMDRSDFDRIASDLRVSPSELDELSGMGPPPAMNCRSFCKHSASMKPISRARNHWSCATWNGYALSACTSGDATTILPQGPPQRTSTNIASMRRRSRRSTNLRASNAALISPEPLRSPRR